MTGWPPRHHDTCRPPLRVQTAALLRVPLDGVWIGRSADAERGVVVGGVLVLRVAVGWSFGGDLGENGAIRQHCGLRSWSLRRGGTTK